MIIAGLIIIFVAAHDWQKSFNNSIQTVHTVCIRARSLYLSLSTGLAVEDAVTAHLVYDRQHPDVVTSHPLPIE